jgi:hypothetical protein
MCAWKKARLVIVMQNCNTFSETLFQQSYCTVMKQTYEGRDLQICFVFCGCQKVPFYFICTVHPFVLYSKCKDLKRKFLQKNKINTKTFLCNGTHFKIFLLVCPHSCHIVKHPKFISHSRNTSSGRFFLSHDVGHTFHQCNAIFKPNLSNCV